MSDCPPRQFCSGYSRIFSGNPDALLAKDAQIQNSELVVASLTSPFQFDLTFPPSGVPQSQVWHVSRWSLDFFAPANIGNLDLNTIIAQLIPIPSVAASSTLSAGGPPNPNLFGVELTQVASDLSNGSGWGFQSVFYDAPLDIPPGWALRVSILDNNQAAQPVLPGGTRIRISAFLETFPVDFADPVKYP